MRKLSLWSTYDALMAQHELQHYLLHDGDGRCGDDPCDVCARGAAIYADAESEAAHAAD